MCLCGGAYVHMNADATPSTHTQGAGNAGSCESCDVGPRSQDWVLCKSITAEGGLSPFQKLIIQYAPNEGSIKSAEKGNQSHSFNSSPTSKIYLSGSQ